MAYLKSLEGNSEIDFWSDLRHINENVDVMVSPQLQDMFEWQLHSKSISYNVMLDDVEK